VADELLNKPAVATGPGIGIRSSAVRQTLRPSA
jgi:hypothetical protein